MNFEIGEFEISELANWRIDEFVNSPIRQQKRGLEREEKIYQLRASMREGKIRQLRAGMCEGKFTNSPIARRYLRGNIIPYHQDQFLLMLHQQNLRLFVSSRAYFRSNLYLNQHPKRDYHS